MVKQSEGQKVVFDRSRLYELLVYAAMWLLVLLFPLLNEALQSSRGLDFSWSDVGRWWLGAIPFLLLFVIHNHILIPKLLFEGRGKWYAAATFSLLLLFGYVQYTSLETKREHFRREMEQNFPQEMLQRHEPRQNGMPTEGRVPMHERVPSQERPGQEAVLGLPAQTPPPPHAAMRGPLGLPAPFLMNLIMAVLMLGMNLGIVYMFKYQREQENRRALEHMRQQDELKYLKAQINPHFFMNMLNNIHAMVETDTEKAQDMILELSKLMRYVLYGGENHMTTFANEVHFLQSYIAIMRQRYPDSKVGISLDVPSNPSDALRLPPLLFIPFVENAFKHGISYRRRSEVEVALEAAGGRILFHCRNTKPLAEAGAKKPAGGVGLENVRRRLDLIYGDTYFLDLDDREEEYIVTLKIPCI